MSVVKGTWVVVSIFFVSFFLMAASSGAAQKSADLIVSGMTAPSSAAPGELISVIFTVQNTGDGTAKASTLTCSLQGTLLGTASIKGLGVGASYTGSLNVTIPSALANKTYTLSLAADSADVVRESNEGNNTRATPLLIAAPPPTGQAILSWNPSITTTVTGYNIYKGTAPNVYGAVYNVGNVTTYTLTDLAGGSTYYFAATAYDAGGQQSIFSNEVSKTIP